MSAQSQSFLLAGIMSGTSADGVDAVIAEYNQQRCVQKGFASCAFPTALRQEIIALNSGTDNEIARSQLLGIELAHRYAEVLHKVLQVAGMQSSQLAGCAVHGQTIRHQPAAGYSVQAINLPLLAERAGVAVIGDFRNRDIAAGGQGAPLACGFHQWFFRDQTPCAVLNLGGFSNLTLLQHKSDPLGFDCGPMNVLLDLWAQRHLGSRYDANGEWAATGNTQQALLEAMQQHAFFALPPPKSTGRDDFHGDWLDDLLVGTHYRAEDVQATLVSLSAWSIAQHLIPYPAIGRVLVCGGGIHNASFMHQLKQLLPRHTIASSARFGIAPHSVEAMAFAWLGWRHLTHKPGNLPAVTGASAAKVLGCYYPA